MSRFLGCGYRYEFQQFKILIAQGAAKDIFDVQPVLTPSVSTTIMDRLKQQSKSSRLIAIDLPTFYSKLTTGGDLLIGRITSSDHDGLKIAGSGVIKQGKLIGWLNEEETKAAHFIIPLVIVVYIISAIPKNNIEVEKFFEFLTPLGITVLVFISLFLYIIALIRGVKDS